ncbi:MAG: hypothetical protein U0587_00035 [Candidatus Binatia bacterium]
MAIVLTIFVVTARPVARPSGHLYGRLGLTRMALLTEPANDDAPSPPAPTAAISFVCALPLAGILLLRLKTRRTGFDAVPIRRLKLPPSRTAGSPFSD